MDEQVSRAITVGYVGVASMCSPLRKTLGLGPPTTSEFEALYGLSVIAGGASDVILAPPRSEHCDDR